MVKNQPDETTAFWLGEQLKGKALRFRLSAFLLLLFLIFLTLYLMLQPQLIRYTQAFL